MHLFTRSSTLALAAILAIAGCSGTDGKNGLNGANGVDGVNGTPGAAASCTVVTVTGTTTISCTDGTTGTVTNGTNGINGTSCTLAWNANGSRTVTCPDGNTLDFPAVVIPGRLTVANEAVADSATSTANLAFNVDIKVDGVARDEFKRLTTVRTWVFNAVAGAGTRTTLTITSFTVKANGNGNYTITMPGYGSTGATPAVAGTAFLVNLNAGVPQPAATAVAVLGGTMNANVLVDDQACMNCHGENVFNKVDAAGVQLGHEDNYNPKGVNACVVCHDRDSTAETRLGTNGTRLMGYVHGIHNSHNMPGATKLDGTTAVAGGTYYRNFNSAPTAPAVVTGVSAASMFSIGFPSYMDNCSTCHTAASLPTVAAVPVTWAACMSCHAGPPTIVTPGSTTAEVAPGFVWAGFGVPNSGTAAAPAFSFGGANHASYNATTPQSTCNACHDGTTAPATIAGFHNGMKTERNGLIWDAADQSVVEGAKFALAVTGVTRAGLNFQVTWTASYNGAPVDPCNADLAVGPVFMGVAADAPTGKSLSNMQFIMAFGQGDDWVNANRTGSVSPGQPATGATLTMAPTASPNTTCAANVATSVVTIPTDGSAAAGIRAAMALQGKPQLRFAPAAGTSGEFIQARAKSPVFIYAVPAADGAATAGAARRAVVDTAKCLACHKGTLYQHGGNRVDNVELCDTCHNPASSEQQNRVLFGVTAAEAYDGKVGETYDMRTMTHSIHAAGENGRSYVIYRTRGIYFFGNAASFADAVANKNWPTTGGFTCTTAEGPATYYPVYGSLANGTTDRMPVITAGLCDTATGPILTNTEPLWQIHNVVLVEYPRPLNQCTACHTGGSDQVFPDPTKAVAVTVNAGAAPWGVQTDDTLIGSSAQSCMTCHQSGDMVTQAQLRGHAYQNGWSPAVFTNGRTDLLNFVQVESCSVCHGAGKTADFGAAHNR
jgi:OmcA/MtrC family decaheme c-type cytochrome